TTLFSVYSIWIGIVSGLIMLIIVKKNMAGEVLAGVADVTGGEIRFEGPAIFVGDILIKNVGLEDIWKVIIDRAVGVIVTPKNQNSIVTLSHLGQRQAMLHHVATVLGAFLDSGEPALVPLSKRDMADGRIALFILPREKDFQQIKTVLDHVPVL